MTLRAAIEARYAASTAELVALAEFQRLERGEVGHEAYDLFLANVIRAHLKSPKILAFLYSASAPKASADLLHNMLEELGVEEEDGTSHPELLRRLAHGAGLGEALPGLEQLADDDLKAIVVEPLMYGTLRDVALAVLIETIAYEWMLSRTSGRIAAFLQVHRGLDAATLAWFSHHSEVDVRHAEEGLDAIARTVDYYAIPTEDAETILELTMRENVFIKRYFGELTHDRLALMARR
ncbi:MAG: iron-containing redox enzyme family protein [Candidatus Sericytochromatia bacterium]|nr:iron-containing redox enzyme family protein [Candidatus Sericytochromatia bacterium]